MTRGRPVVSQWANALAAIASSSGVSPMSMRSREPSSRSAANRRSRPSSEASSAPIHRIAGPIRCNSARSGPDGERDQGHHGEEEQDAHEGAAADPQGNADVASEQGGEGGHGVAPRRMPAIATDLTPSFPPPLRGRDREGASHKFGARDHPPPHPSPARGEGAGRIRGEAVFTPIIAVIPPLPS